MKKRKKERRARSIEKGQRGERRRIRTASFFPRFVQTNEESPPHLLSRLTIFSTVFIFNQREERNAINPFAFRKTTFWATSTTSSFDTDVRFSTWEKGERERGRERDKRRGLRVRWSRRYPGEGREGRTRKRVITDWSGELLRWMPDNKLLQDQFLEFEESWPSCGKKMRGRKDGVEGRSGRPTVTRTWKASSPSQHSSLILSELLSRSGRGSIQGSILKRTTWRVQEKGWIFDSITIVVPKCRYYSWFKCVQRENYRVIFFFFNWCLIFIEGSTFFYRICCVFFFAAILSFPFNTFIT